MIRIFILCLLAVSFATPALAVNPDEMLKDPAAEARAKEIGSELRCLVCQNESIEASNAELAGDLRVLVRERVSAGDSNDQVIDYVVSRYGDYVLLNPPMKFETLLLWGGPFLFLALGILGVWSFYRRKDDVPVTTGQPTTRNSGLSEAEQQRLQALLEDNDK
ncbi:cytochrome c-type biogenesis protein [Magnetospira sp. QH-2]|uniref:cytochrome c-type biogenesis protein n=1 Tax=Magnetospira sp. (strain QH-2) TaxID=1288970 RepID=UPI0003E81A57|nr:cytochrome c-type biogenesis protein [Magnetospira sp. QH-2]CCQ75363.1 Cytochrome c-type biogenesis protein ccmH [Magnetospira sp. QH-2]